MASFLTDDQREQTYSELSRLARPDDADQRAAVQEMIAAYDKGDKEAFIAALRRLDFQGEGQRRIDSFTGQDYGPPRYTIPAEKKINGDAPRPDATPENDFVREMKKRLTDAPGTEQPKDTPKHDG